MTVSSQKLSEMRH